VLVGLALVRTHSLHVPLQPNLVGGVSSFLLYVSACFCIEEVAFRGVLDAHVHGPGAPRGFSSAVFVSVLWGLWHWPIVPHAGSWWALPLQLIAVHTVIGVPLSHFWRRSGNLAVPVVTHAFIDAVRNALLAQLM
jgi:membrane protease YdiL (CAAX protease family)